jgi:hypothetical protein
MKKSPTFKSNVDVSSTIEKKGPKIPIIALGALGLIVVCGGAFALYNTGHIGGKKQLPPGPRPWAVFGTSMHLGTTPCQAMAKLCSCTYGGIMTIYMGNIPTVIITSSKIAMQVCIKTNLNKLKLLYILMGKN